ncbi:MAG: pitrilysin family protein [Acidobacteriota bacterium]
MKSNGLALKRAVLCLFAGLALSAPATQLAAREFPPSVPPPEPVTFHMPAVHQLANGLRVVLVERRDLPIVRLYAIVKIGAESDPPKLPGTASLVAGLLPEGTKHRSAYQIARAIDQAGGSIDTGAGWDESYVNVSVLSDHKDLAFDLLGDLLIHPDFARKEIHRLREQTLSALDVVDQDPSYVADIVLRQALFAGTPYAHPEDGTRESIENVTRRDLLDFHRKYYVPSRTILAVVGDITEPECLSLATKFLGGWKNRPGQPVQPQMKPRSLHSREVVVVDKPDAVQTEIRVASLGISRANPDYFALSVATQILGGPAANRLFDVLRTEHGLVYGASSHLDCYSSLGAWVAKTSTRSTETVKATEMVLSEIARLRGRPVRHWELQNAQDYLVGHEALQFDSASQVANQILEMMLYHLPADYWSRFPQEIRSLTAADVLATTRKYLDPNDDVIVLVGNVSAFKSSLKKLGTVRVIPIADVSRAFPPPQKGTADRPAPGR